ncbi:hypothetical protein GUJ93_ZPchr0001g29249 [Zizania palustris]|uniref:EF-hand domain-containing protein n=1 Tax=Zizania palustris TaxID=103762 RepID=A0A8J5SGA8_ZIZPA|nr:hypothetical protein GUJ93_ZPchr0001g29249 [Zizania palustris]
MHGETASKNLMESWTPPSSSLFKHPATWSYLSSPAGVEGDMGSALQFEDFLPSMARKLGVEGLIEELCKGFQLLMDPGAGKITFQSLRRNAARLGLGELRDDELSEMMREGDLDGDGALDQMEFCILMVRLSPELMLDESYRAFQC